ncbi:MAG: hypothetical protein QM727_12895 [Niabella sp.]
MKYFLMLVLATLTLNSHAQDKYDYVAFNKLTEITGTEYVIASVEHWGKLQTQSRHLLFINTNTGQANQLDFPSDAHIDKLEQVKIDNLGINKIIVAAKTFDLNGKKGIDWEDPIQIIVLSTDGKEKTQLTDNKFFAGQWLVNKQTGRIVITGYYDTNNNNKRDKKDKHEILIYDLTTLKQVGKAEMD